MTEYKYTRNKASLEKYVKALNDEKSKFDNGDENFWKPEKDKSGSAYAVIRFLPAPPQDGDDGLPWVKLFSYGFQGPTGKWYIENSLKTPRPGFPKGSDDPVAELNNLLYNSNPDQNSSERKQASNQKRRLSYVSNILVVDDPKNPQNNGKVFLFKYGKKIKDKIDEKLSPQIEGKKSVNIFDPFEGMNFELTVKTIKTGNNMFPNYDDSSFASASPIANDEKEFSEIWSQEKSLLELVAPSQFKTYDELKKRLEEVLDENGASKTRAKTVTEDGDETPPWRLEKEAAAKATKVDLDDDDIDDAEMEKFRKMALEIED